MSHHLKRINNSQLALFHEKVKDILERIQLSLNHAELLFKEGLLSFNPELTRELLSSEEAELLFVGTLTKSFLSLETLKNLLKSLSFPYSYSLNHIYYDWINGEWQNFPEERSVTEIIDEIEDVEELESLHDLIEDKIKDHRKDEEDISASS
jgi:hypothetical protein